MMSGSVWYQSNCCHDLYFLSGSRKLIFFVEGCCIFTFACWDMKVPMKLPIIRALVLFMRSGTGCAPELRNGLSWKISLQRRRRDLLKGQGLVFRIRCLSTRWRNLHRTMLGAIDSTRILSLTFQIIGSVSLRALKFIVLIFRSLRRKEYGPTLTWVDGVIVKGKVSSWKDSTFKLRVISGAVWIPPKQRGFQANETKS